MGTFILGVLIPLPCDDPLDVVEQAIKPYEGEGNRTDGWQVLEFQLSKRVDATPYAYIAADGSWCERAADRYPEETAYAQQIRTIAQSHLTQHGPDDFDVLRQRMGEVPQSVTDWHRTWHHVTHEKMCIVVFVWCHC